MSGTLASASRSPSVPVEMAARFELLFQDFLAIIDHGVESGAAHPAQVTRWKRARTLLQKDLTDIRTARQQNQQGTSSPLVLLGARLRYLAREMDGYRLDFAGDDIAERLEKSPRLVVLTAWQVYEAGRNFSSANQPAVAA